MARPTIDDIRAALKISKGNKAAAARELGMPRTSLITALGTSTETEMDLYSEHALRRENARLRRDLKGALDARIEGNDVADLYRMGGELEVDPPLWMAPIRKPRDMGESIAVAFLSDTHFDEVVHPEQVNYVNGYDREIATRRLENFFQNVVRMNRDYIAGVNISGMVLAMGGDMVSGNIHEELKESNQEGILDTVLYWTEQLAAGIDLLADTVPYLYVPCVVGNHGRLDKKPRAKGAAHENYDYLIYRLLEREFSEYDNVTFDVSSGVEQRFTIYDTRFILMHGDDFKGGTGISGMLAPLMLGQHRTSKREVAIGTPFDYMLIGHWHQLAFLPGLMVNGSLKGYDEFAMRKKFGFQAPEQAYFLVDPKHGVTIRTPIRCMSSKESWASKRGRQVK